MAGKSKRWLTGGLTVAGCLILGILLYYLGIHQIWEMQFNQWKAAVVKGAPEFTYQGMTDLYPTENGVELKEGEVRFPSEGQQIGELIWETGDWKVPLYYGDSEEVFEKGVGICSDGVVPGQNGTILAGAHDTTYFSELDRVQIDDILSIRTYYGTYTYRVTDTDILNARETQDILQGETEQLILYTCYPFGETDRIREERYLVYAERIILQEEEEKK